MRSIRSSGGREWREEFLSAMYGQRGKFQNALPLSSRHEITRDRNLVMGTIIKVLVIALLFAGCIYFLTPKRPKEAALIQNFNEHRVVFEQLRDMLEADTNLSRVAQWGVDTRNPPFLGYPSETNFPTKRFLKYLNLLAQANGYVGVRSDGDHADVGVVLWGSGFAGSTRHIWIYWMNETPTNRNDVSFQHIDHNWYLLKD